MITEKNIFEHGMLISLNAGGYEGRKKLTKEQLAGLPTEIVRGVFDIFDKEFKSSLKEIDALTGEAREHIKRISVPFPIDGVYFLLSVNIAKAIEYLDGVKESRSVKVSGVLDQYEMAKEAFKTKYPDYYKIAQKSYPSKEKLAEKFYFRYQFIKISAPDKNTLISPEQYKIEMAKFKETIEEMKKEVLATIYQTLLETTTRLKKQCTEGKPNQRTLNTLNTFLQQVDEVYGEFVDRKEMKDAIKKIKASVLGITAENLRDSESTKEKFAKEIAAVAREIQALPDIPLKRAIDF